MVIVQWFRLNILMLSSRLILARCSGIVGMLRLALVS